MILCCALDKVFRTLLGNKRKSGGLNIFFGAYEPGHIGAIAALYTEVNIISFDHLGLWAVTFMSKDLLKAPL